MTRNNMKTIVATYKSYPQIKSTRYIKEYESQNGIVDSYRFHKLLLLQIYE